MARVPHGAVKVHHHPLVSLIVATRRTIKYSYVYIPDVHMPYREYTDRTASVRSYRGLPMLKKGEARSIHRP
eukprot:SAG22_NODE_3410_length_1729_cov_2.131288_2_plen_72_part_00